MLLWCEGSHAMQLKISGWRLARQVHSVPSCQQPTGKGPGSRTFSATLETCNFQRPSHLCQARAKRVFWGRDLVHPERGRLAWKPRPRQSPRLLVVHSLSGLNYATPFLPPDSNGTNLGDSQYDIAVVCFPTRQLMLAVEAH